MKLCYLISYDIRDDYRLSRVLRYMKGRGIHLQYSVFYCYLKPEELLKIIEDILAQIDEKEDDVRIYPMNRRFRAIFLGRGAPIPEGVDIFLE